MFLPRSPPKSPSLPLPDPTGPPAATEADILAALNTRQTQILPRHEFNAIIKGLPGDLSLGEKKQAVIKARDEKCLEYQLKADEYLSAMTKGMRASEDRAQDSREISAIRQTGCINACILYVPKSLWAKVPGERVKARKRAERKAAGVSKPRRKPSQPRKSESQPTRRSQRIKEKGAS